jgi:hypothetical protein
MKTSIGNLEEQIGQLVRQHLRDVRSAVASVVERAFASAVRAEEAQQPRRRRPGKTAARIGRRRASDEVSVLSERLYGAIIANPGATMTVLAAHVGASARELNRSATLLRRAGQVRSAGQRQATRYFPMANKEAA